MNQFSLLKAEQVKSKSARWGCKHGFGRAEKTGVVLFIGLHAVQNNNKNIKSDIWPPKHVVITVINREQVSYI